MFRFLVEEKIKCLATEKVKYTQRVDYIMQLPVPMDAALNKGRGLSARPGCGCNLRAMKSVGHLIGAEPTVCPAPQPVVLREAIGGSRINLAHSLSAGLC